jgi:hypothetical protein
MYPRPPGTARRVPADRAGLEAPVDLIGAAIVSRWNPPGWAAVRPRVEGAIAAVVAIGVARYVESAQSGSYAIAYHSTAHDWAPLL